MLLIPFSLAGCKDDGKTKIRVSEVTHSIFYAPFYIAINQGYFEEMGIKIELSNAGGSDKVMTSIASKSADIGLLGPEATVYCHVEGQRDYPIIFGLLTQKDGSFLVSKKNEPDFAWSDLKGKHVLAGRPGGMPAMALQYVIEKTGGLKLNELNFDTSVAFDMMVGAFDGNPNIEYCTMFEPTASEFVAEGKGYVVASVGESTGVVPYTGFSASKTFLQNKRDIAANFLKAVKKGYDYLKNNNPAIVAKALTASFEGTSEEFIAASIERYLSIDAWCHDFILTEESFNRLQDIMENAGSLSSRADYSLAVDNSIAESL